MKGPDPVRQDEVIAFMRREFERTGSPPTLQQICAHLKINSRSSVHRMIGHLIRRKMLAHRKRSHVFVLLPTKSWHLPACNCQQCAERRYVRQLQKYKGLMADPPFAVIAARKDNIRLLPDATRSALLGKAAFPPGADRPDRRSPGGHPPGGSA